MDPRAHLVVVPAKNRIQAFYLLSSYFAHLPIIKIWSRAFHEKLVVAKLVKKFLAFYGTRSVYKSPPLDRVLSHMYPVRLLTAYFLEIHYNIILPSTPRSPKLSFPFRRSN
jgi:hypothetical protein